MKPPVDFDAGDPGLEWEFPPELPNIQPNTSDRNPPRSGADGTPDAVLPAAEAGAAAEKETALTRMAANRTLWTRANVITSFPFYKMN